MRTRPRRRSRDGGVRVVLVGLVALVTAGIAVGLLVSWLSTRALEATGIDDGGSDTETTAPTDGPGRPRPTTTRGPTRSTPTTPDPPPPGQRTLVPSSQAVGSFEQVTLSGRFPGVPPGTTLQVERREGGSWVTFPVTATTDATGGFSTFVELGQLGPNVLRLTLPGSARSTPPVTVNVS